jgi:pilus assembly protein Flp/PilA
VGPGTQARHDSKDKGGETEVLSNLYLKLRELAVRKTELEEKDDEEGQGMVEYALILVLIAIVVIVILTVVGKQVNNVFSNISSGLGS